MTALTQRQSDRERISTPEPSCMQRATIPLLVTNGAALLEWKQMARTQPCMVGAGRGGRRGEECGSGQMKGEGENEIMKGEKKDGGGVNLVKAAETKCPHKRNGEKREESPLFSYLLSLPSKLSLPVVPLPLPSQPVILSSYLSRSPVTVSAVSVSDVAPSVCVCHYCSGTF